ncbi:arylsulfatase [Altererythrobacter sp. ZODW24]|uniref:arylsulfatase B n=1 Tax=Altererythrobacter sp. ZODW24 TaxID=2185142 RepID=UPI0013B3E328|nr:arylsulfatase [Altererythrobacter sp. ZODW24]
MFILVDDVGWNDVGYHGSEISTPNIDALAESGVKLERSYVFPICSPTRAALMTGQNPLKFGIDSPMALDGTLPLDLTLLPERLKTAGYDTWLVGKWHLGHTEAESLPNARGFDHYYGLLNGWVDHYTHVFNGGLDWQRNGTSIREKGHTTALLTKEARDLIDEHDGDNPFFLYMAYDAPHTPLQLIDGVAKSYPEIENMDRRVYAEMMTDLDAHIGQLVSTLEAKGLLENTLIVVMSDNGGDGPLGSSNAPLKGGKGLAFDGGLRTPALVSWRGHLAPNQTLEDPVYIQNWAPTLLDAAGIEYPDAQFDGASHWALIKDNTQSDSRQPVAIAGPQSKAVFLWPYKYVRHTPRFETTVTTHLYNIEDDPRETTDVADKYPKIAEQLAAHLAQYDGIESIAEKGPRPEGIFQNEDGSYNYSIRLPETRAPWAEAKEGTE